MLSPLFKPTDEQRSALLQRRERLLRPETVLELLRAALPAELAPAAVTHSAVQSAHLDRFVLRVQTRSHSGAESVYALKSHCDGFGARVWSFTRAISSRAPDNGDERCLPIAYAGSEDVLVFPWVDGVLLSHVRDARMPTLLRRAAGLTAALHRFDFVPEPPTTVQMLIEETRARRDRLRRHWLPAVDLFEPALAQLQEAADSLDPTEPAPVHGDLGTAQFLWTGSRLVMFDWDGFGYADPAYDVGHFLAQLDRVAILDPALRVFAPEWIASFRDAYRAVVPSVSPRNVAFYRAMTLLWKVHTICRVQPTAWPTLVPQLILAAQAALQSGVFTNRAGPRGLHFGAELVPGAPS
jgi:hypothetical protein